MNTLSKRQCYSNVKVEVSSPIMWMNAAEVMFLRAEAALRGWDTEKNTKKHIRSRHTSVFRTAWSKECRRLPSKH